MYERSVRGPGTITKELWTKEVNIPELKTSYEYVTELYERLEDSLKLVQEELILLPTDSNKLVMQWRGPYTVESHVGANNYRIKMGSKTKTYHVNMLKKYIAREPKVDVVHTSNKDDVTIAVTRVIYQDTDPELGEVPDLEGHHQKEAVRDVKLGEDLSED